MGRDWLEVLADNLAVRQKPDNYDVLRLEGNVDNLLMENVRRLTGILKRKDDFVHQLGSQMGTDGKPETTREEVSNWVNSDPENIRILENYKKFNLLFNYVILTL